MLKQVVSKRGHFMDNRGKEILVGAVLSIIGLVLLWDAFDGRGKKLPWPVSAAAPW